MDIYLSEQAIRKLIRQELAEVLFEQTASNEQKIAKEIGTKTIESTKQEREKAKSDLGRIFGAVAISAVVAMSHLPASEAKIEIDSTTQLSNVVDKKQEELNRYGLTEQGTSVVINFALKTAEENLKNDRSYMIADEQKKQEMLINKQIEEIQKVKDINVAKNILIVQFDNKIASIGWRITTDPEQFGAATKVTAGEFGVTYMARQTKSNDTDIVKYDPNEKMAYFNPADVSYWDQYVVNGGAMDKRLHDVFSDVKVQPFVYNFVVQQEAGITAMEDVPKSDL
jgi:hypothetical protein